MKLSRRAINIPKRGVRRKLTAPVGGGVGGGVTSQDVPAWADLQSQQADQAMEQMRNTPALPLDQTYASLMAKRYRAKKRQAYKL